MKTQDIKYLGNTAILWNIHAHYSILFSDLKCSNILRLIRDKFPFSDAYKLGTYLDISSAKRKEFRKNNSDDAEGMLIEVLDYWQCCGGL